MNMEMTIEEKVGVEAMKFLLSLTNDKRPEWVLLRDWRAFTTAEKEFTISTYNEMKKVVKGGEADGGPVDPADGVDTGVPDAGADTDVQESSGDTESPGLSSDGPADTGTGIVA